MNFHLWRKFDSSQKSSIGFHDVRIVGWFIHLKPKPHTDVDEFHKINYVSLLQSSSIEGEHRETRNFPDHTKAAVSNFQLEIRALPPLLRRPKTY